MYVKSTKGIKRLTKKERSLIFIPDNLNEALVGIILSDSVMCDEDHLLVTLDLYLVKVVKWKNTFILIWFIIYLKYIIIKIIIII